MFYISSSSRRLLFLGLVCCFLFWHPTAALRLLKGDTANSIRDSSSPGFSCQLMIEVCRHFPVVELHEVQSGPNPISNSLPKAKKSPRYYSEKP